jgi:hypothetical protein
MFCRRGTSFCVAAPMPPARGTTMTEPTPQRMLSGIESFDAIVGDSTRTPHGTGLLPNTAVVFSTQN